MAQPTVGYKAAWLLWPDSGSWPADGEIDFPEGDLPGTISAFAHFANPQGGQNAFVTGVKWNAWHTATTEWLPGRINFYLDGQLIGTSTKQVPTHAMHWVLQTETALNGTRPSPSSVGHVYVDWVVAYARS
jgi:beta-glucanase (GH16 family)